jgi:hypothetical protein
MCVSQISLRLLKAAIELGVFPATYNRRSHCVPFTAAWLADFLPGLDFFSSGPDFVDEADRRPDLSLLFMIFMLVLSIYQLANCIPAPKSHFKSLRQQFIGG